MGEPRRLTMQQLGELERLLVDQRAPIAEHFREPTTAEAIEELESSVGFPIPAELRLWWSWHDGAASDGTRRNATIGPWFFFFGSAEALAATEHMRKVVARLALEPDWGVEIAWKESWLAITDVGRVACECRASVDTASVIGVEIAPTKVGARSLGELVDWWIEALESGAWRYGRNRPLWDRIGDLIPLEAVGSGLV
jgi:hypothetical protein